jgi:putative transposase
VCQYTCSRDVAAAQIVMQRGLSAIGQIVLENACRDGLAGANGNASLVKNLRSRKSLGRLKESLSTFVRHSRTN